MVQCSVIGCTSRSNGKSDVSFHCFPADLSLRMKWIKLCGRKHVNVKHAKVCSLHFTSKSYTLKSRRLPYLNTKFRRLEEDAFPSLLLPKEVIYMNDHTREEKQIKTTSVKDVLTESGESKISIIRAKPETTLEIKPIPTIDESIEKCTDANLDFLRFENSDRDLSFKITSISAATQTEEKFTNSVLSINRLLMFNNCKLRKQIKALQKKNAELERENLFLTKEYKKRRDF